MFIKRSYIRMIWCGWLISNEIYPLFNVLLQLIYFSHKIYLSFKFPVQSILKSF